MYRSPRRLPVYPTDRGDASGSGGLAAGAAGSQAARRRAASTRRRSGRLHAGTRPGEIGAGMGSRRGLPATCSARPEASVVRDSRTDRAGIPSWIAAGSVRRSAIGRRFPSQFKKVLSEQFVGVRQTLENRAAIALDEDFRSGLDNWASPGRFHHRVVFRSIWIRAARPAGAVSAFGDAGRLPGAVHGADR